MQFACAKCEKPIPPGESTADVPPAPELRCAACGATWPNKWWVVIRGDKRGPMTVAELIALAERREIEGRTFVWTNGFGPWIRVAQVEALKSLWPALAAVAPASRPLPRPEPHAAIPPAAAPAAQAPTMPAAPAPAPSAAPTPPTGSGLRPRLTLRSMPPPPLPTTGSAPRVVAELASAPAAPPAPASPIVPSSVPAALDTSPLIAVAAAAEAVSPVALGIASPEPDPVPRSVSPVAETLLFPVEEISIPQPTPASGHADHHEDLFFAAAGAPRAPAAAGASAAAGADLIDLKHVLEDMAHAEANHVAPIGTSPTGFSMVARIHRPDKKRWLVFGGVVLLLGAAAVLVAVLLPPSEPTLPRTHAPLVASNHPTAPPATPPPAPAPAPHEEAKAAPPPRPELETTAKVDPQPSASGASTTSSPPVTNKVVKPKTGETGKNSTGTAAGEGANHGLTKEQFAALTEDDVGKQEVKLEFDPGAAARKAADAAAVKEHAAASNLAQDVAAAFGKKKTQFARCSDGNQERVRLVFTVTPTGKVTNTQVDGTASGAKTQCLTEILGRAIFPAGSESATYAQVLVL